MIMLYIPAILILVYAQIVIASRRDGDRCSLQKSNVIGHCTSPQRCQSAKDDFINHGTRPTFCEYSSRKLLVCCKDSRRTAPMKLKEQRPGRVGSDSVKVKQRVSERKCAEYNRGVVQKIPVVVFVAGGDAAIQGEFPHMCAIGWVNFSGKYVFSCGGSLISRRFVLTAGHCSSKARTFNPLPVMVRVGDVNLDPSVDHQVNPVDVKIKRIHKHPGFRPPNRYNDIALLELVADVALNERIRPACLWTRSDFGAHKQVVAAGWGVTDIRNQQPSTHLRKVTLSLFTNNYCGRFLRTNRNWGGFASSQMCAGELGGGKDTCQGDSGAPLQVTYSEKRSVYYIMGLTSFGGRCAEKGQPAIYTRVSSYLDWIEGIVWAR